MGTASILRSRSLSHIFRRNISPLLSIQSRSVQSSHSNQLFRKFPVRPLPQYRTHRRSPFSSSPGSTSFPDPSRPDLFYHLVDSPTLASSSSPAFALSFLPSPPPTPDSSTIIGWLPAESSGETSQRQEAGLNDFQENPKFRGVLHRAIKDGLIEEVDDIHINGALQLQEGWMHIHDTRNIPALGRIGDPDDILASVLVRESKIIPETYQPMPSYRFCTTDGVLQLTPGLMKKLHAVLIQVGNSEETP